MKKRSLKMVSFPLQSHKYLIINLVHIFFSSFSILVLFQCFQSNTMNTCLVLIIWDKPSFPPINSLKIWCRINCSWRVITSSTIQIFTFPYLTTATQTQRNCQLHPVPLPSYCVLTFKTSDLFKGSCAGNNGDSPTFANCTVYIWSTLKTVEKMSIKFPHVSPRSLLRSLVFHIVFPLFLWAFPTFPLVFLPLTYFRSYV